MMQSRILLVCALAGAAWAQSGISVPQAGCTAGREGVLRALYGTAASFVPGAPVQTGVISASCSGRFALVKTERALEVRDPSLRLIARRPAPEGDARFTFTSAGTAFVYYVTTGELICVSAKGASCAAPDFQSLWGDVLAIASPDALHLDAIVRTGTQLKLLRLTRSGGRIVRFADLAPVAGPLMLRPDGTILFGAGGELVVLRPSGEERRFTLPAGALWLYEISESYVGIALASGPSSAAVRLDAGREQLYLLPEAPL